MTLCVVIVASECVAVFFACLSSLSLASLLVGLCVISSKICQQVWSSVYYTHAVVVGEESGRNHSSRDYLLAGRLEFKPHGLD
jgi:hypothetical protein